VSACFVFVEVIGVEAESGQLQSWRLWPLTELARAARVALLHSLAAGGEIACALLVRMRRAHSVAAVVEEPAGENSG
jgi:hypothetical protein